MFMEAQGLVKMEQGLETLTRRQVLSAYAYGLIDWPALAERLGMTNFSDLAAAMAEAELDMPVGDQVSVVPWSGMTFGRRQATAEFAC
jgi:hypothetical protein